METPNQINILMAGCGFLASHLTPHLIPHANHIVLVDKERVEKINYDNYIIPKNYTGRRKVSAFASLLQILSSVQVFVDHSEISDTTQLVELCREYEIDLMVVTFDNIQARIIAKKCALELGVHSIFIGVTERLVYIDWEEWVSIPEDPDKVRKAETELSRIRDVCSRLEFRELGVLASGYAYHCIMQFLDTGQKKMYQVSVDDRINSSSLERNKVG
jgi:hypothetical protein